MSESKLEPVHFYSLISYLGRARILLRPMLLLRVYHIPV